MNQLSMPWQVPATQLCAGGNGEHTGDGGRCFTAWLHAPAHPHLSAAPQLSPEACCQTQIPAACGLEIRPNPVSGAQISSRNDQDSGQGVNMR